MIINNCAYRDYKGNLHRNGGPALINSIGTFYYRHGELHREDGPAIIRNDGIERWYVHGRRIESWEEFSVETGKTLKEVFAIVIAGGWKSSPVYP